MNKIHDKGLFTLGTLVLLLSLLYCYDLIFPAIESKIYTIKNIIFLIVFIYIGLKNIFTSFKCIDKSKDYKSYNEYDKIKELKAGDFTYKTTGTVCGIISILLFLKNSNELNMMALAFASIPFMMFFIWIIYYFINKNNR